MTKWTFETIITYATFVAPDGNISKSEVMYDLMNDYEYVADGKGDTWLLDEVDIIATESIKQTETFELPDLEELE